MVVGVNKMAKSTTIKRGRGRPLKEESNAIAAEKAIIDYKSELIKIIPEAFKTLKDLMATASSDKVKEGIAKFFLEEGKDILKEYIEQDNENEAEATANVIDVDENKPTQKPFTTDIQSI